MMRSNKKTKQTKSMRYIERVYIISILLILSISISTAATPIATLSINSGNPSAGQPFSVKLTTSITEPITVKYLVDGASYSTENYAPYCLFGDDGVNCYTKRFANDGSHTIKANIYRQNSNTLLAAASIIVDQKAASNAPAPTTVPTSTPIKTPTSTPTATPNPTSSLASLAINNGDPSAGQPYTIKLTTSITDPITVKYLVDSSVYSTENYAPYCIFGDDGTNCYTSRLSQDGSHTVKANVYPQGGSNLLATASIVVNQKAASNAPAPATVPTSTPTKTPATTPTVLPSPTQSPIVTGAYYVATNGNDANPGTESSPWRTLKKASNTLKAGDTVYVKSGTYNDRIIPANSGSSGKYISFVAYPGQTPTIDGNGYSFSNYEGMVQIDSKQYIRVSGFNIINSKQTGVHIDNNAANIIIEKNTITGCIRPCIKAGWGYVSNIIIDGNTVDRPSGSGQWPEEAISISNAHTIEVRNNHVVQNADGEGIDLKDGTTFAKVFGNIVENIKCQTSCDNQFPKNKPGIYLDGYAGYEHDIEVYNNIVRNAGFGFAIGSERGGTLENVKFYNNIGHDLGQIGLILSSYTESGTPTFKSIQVINNVFYNTGTTGWGGGIWLNTKSGMTASNMVIRNNIISNGKSFSIAQSTSNGGNIAITIDNNLIDGYRGDTSEGETRGSNYVEGNPQFINPSGGDFHLKSTSPAIDKGSSINAPSTDFDGTIRYKGNGYDIGAFEFLK